VKREFKDIIKNLKKTIANYNYYTNFDKVYENIDKIKIEINILNSLIGSKNIEEEFINVINEYPKTLRVIPILIAVRQSEVPVIDGKQIDFDFKSKTMTDEDYIKFMRKTGLFNLLENSRIKCLFDYVTGVEVGLDTNARKNRTGHSMEDVVESYIKKINNIEYEKEMPKKKISEEYNVDINKLISKEDENDSAEKRFDFVVKTEDKLYLIETNFYSSQGSKLNETARSFKSLNNDIKELENVDFIWITDGIGWKSAKNNLKETYYTMEHLYTIVDLENGILDELLR